MTTSAQRAHLVLWWALSASASACGGGADDSAEPVLHVEAGPEADARPDAVSVLPDLLEPDVRGPLEPDAAADAFAPPFDAAAVTVDAAPEVDALEPAPDAGGPAVVLPGGAEQCGRGQTACGAGDACPGEGRICHAGTAQAPLPVTIEPFCTQLCEADGDCPGGETCRPVGDTRLCLPGPCTCLDSTTPDAVGDALALAGLSRCEAVFRDDIMNLFPENLTADGWRLPFFDVVHRESPRAIDFGRSLTDDWAASEGARGAAGLLESLATTLLGRSPGQALPVAPAAPTVLEAARALWEAADQGPRFNEAIITNAFADVPEPIQTRLAPVLAAMARIVRARNDMLSAAGLDVAGRNDLFDRLPGIMVAWTGGVNFADPAEVRRLHGEMDLSGLLAASIALTDLVETTDWAPVQGLVGFDVDIPTPLGRLVVQDGASQTLRGDATYLLVFDAGGDDRYEAAVAATRGAVQAVSVLIDLGGNDRYGYPEMDAPPEVPGVPPADAAGRDGMPNPASRSSTPRQGVGILGAGLLFDLQGDDVYRSLRLSQGAAVAGVGLLVDSAGADEYACEQGCQAAAAVGVAALIDRGPESDTYSGVQMVQGFGGLRGVACLQDAGGDERYTALPGEALFGGTILYGNPQNPGGSNTSFAQGAGFGRRADADGTYASGGLGVLQDLAGDDVYTVDIFGQATGYWFGTGILRDAGGNDTYNGRWYVQGSSAHFAMSLFYEDAGDDRYNEGLPLADGSGMLGPVIMATATGQGHDFSVGVLVDAAGDDHYVAPGLGVGGGNDNGIGYFLDVSGNDRYDVPDGTTFGQANIGDRGAPFEDALSLGIFADLDGTDRYPTFEDADGMPLPEALVGEGLQWNIDARKPAHKGGERGAGFDAVGAGMRAP